VTLRRARVTVLLVPATVYFFSYFHRVAPAVVAADLMRAFAISAASLGTLVSIYPYVFAGMALVAGSLADTLGPRWTLALGATTMGLGAALFGVAPTFAVAFGGRLLVGLGASVVLISWLSLAAEWFGPAEFGTVSGFTQAVGNVGALVASSPLALVVEAVGWRHAFVLIGGVTLVLSGLAAALVRDRPEALGLPPVNPEGGARRTPSVRETLVGIPDVVRNARTWPPILAAGGVYRASSRSWVCGASRTSFRSTASAGSKPRTWSHWRRPGSVSARRCSAGCPIAGSVGAGCRSRSSRCSSPRAGSL
jgi:MFS family permease